tara:strand:+ start:84 stop:833 length:750 start_codon:yes stop_codon:yes gene_type:complete
VTLVRYLFVVFCCYNIIFAKAESFINITDLSSEKSKYEETLINRQLGLHKMNGYTLIDSTSAIIIIHGYYTEKWDKKGYEWVDPIIELSKLSTPMWFYRYDWNLCPDELSIDLKDHIKIFIQENIQIDSILILGHSLGGLIVTHFSEIWDEDYPLGVYAIASGLKNKRRLKNSCTFLGKNQYFINKNIGYTQWRTVKKIDGVFKNYLFDPQNVKINNGNYVDLPSNWNGKRLGHNYSILYVANQLRLKN